MENRIKKEHKFPYEWTLANANFTKDKGKVFSCFACGGGSTMGYKLAGYDVIGCNEIDPRMNKCYVANHHPKYNFLCDIREMVKAVDLPAELYNLDVLDGSPPCSSFCLSGAREKGWGIEKKFREGQKSQVLDTLFFDFINLAEKLKPKVVIAENVRGIIVGKAKEYTKKIVSEFDRIGYYCHFQLLKAQDMGCPQRRPRVFFTCIRKDLSDDIMVQKDLFSFEPMINLEFNEPIIPYGEICDDDCKFNPLSKALRKAWDLRKEGDSLLSDACEREWNVRKFFDAMIAYKEKVCPTLTAHQESVVPFHKPSFLSENELLKASTFPLDYDFCGQKPNYVCGMSVPPVMMAQVASRVYEQWLSKL